MEQRTIDWFRARLGKITGSAVADIMVKGRAKDQVFGATAMTYIYNVAGERMLNEDIVNDDELFWEYIELVNTSSKAMRWGVENEGDARDLYAKKTGNSVTETGSVEHSEVQRFAASPDGIVCDGEGCIEIKCVSNANFVRYGAITDAETLKATESKYYWQTQAEMACTGAQWCDFIVYNPFMAQPLHIARIDRNEEDINTMLERVKLADELAQQLCDKLKN